MNLSDFDYDLPPELIAQTPAEPRDHSRLLHVNRKTGELNHHHFYDLPNLLKPGDLLVLNDTRVLPVRLFGTKSTGGKVEILLVKRISFDNTSETWKVLTRPGVKPGQVITFAEGFTGTALEQPKEDYTRLLQLSLTGEDLYAALEKYGQMPTPPYIKKFVGDPKCYQTIFAKHPGSAAAPTAGFHFTEKVFADLEARGIEHVFVTLHVGLGTFLGVKEDNILDHKMHSEEFVVSEETAAKINQAIENGQRIIPVGTTSLRTLESAVFDQNSKEGKFLVKAQSGDTELFVYPGYKFKIASALITNFHLPKSTLLLLVAALTSVPQTQENFTIFSENLIGRAYAEAIKNQYHFFSFGDAMFID